MVKRYKVGFESHVHSDEWEEITGGLYSTLGGDFAIEEAISIAKKIVDSGKRYFGEYGLVAEVPHKYISDTSELGIGEHMKYHALIIDRRYGQVVVVVTVVDIW